MIANGGKRDFAEFWWGKSVGALLTCVKSSIGGCVQGLVCLVIFSVTLVPYGSARARLEEPATCGSVRPSHWRVSK
jgi:hypothetical protein